MIGTERGTNMKVIVAKDYDDAAKKAADLITEFDNDHDGLEAVLKANI